MNPIIPPRLRKGDIIGLVALASPPRTIESVNDGVRYLETLGYRVLVGRSVYAQHGYLAGEDQFRARDFNEMILDKNVKAIFSARGGYGITRILPDINFPALKKNPKIILGYSDVTALLFAALAKSQLVTYLGPMVAAEMSKDMDRKTEESLWEMLTTTKKKKIPVLEKKFSIINKKKKNISGTLLAGNMCLITSLLGTPFMPDARGAILALEETGEVNYRIDRMLVQLRNAGILQKLSALAFGRIDHTPGPQAKELTLDQIINEIVLPLGIPIIRTLPFGHSLPMATMAVGEKYSV